MFELALMCISGFLIIKEITRGKIKFVKYLKESRDSQNEKIETQKISNELQKELIEIQTQILSQSKASLSNEKVEPSYNTLKTPKVKMKENRAH